MRTSLLLCCVACLAGCSSAERRPGFCVAASPRAVEPACVAFVANGSGDFQTVSRNLARAAAETASPLEVVTVCWSRGRGRMLADHVGHANHLACGAALAEQVVAYRRAHPGRKVCLVGHSAGSAVVLAAAE